MTKEEYYRQRRIFRAAISSIDRSHLRMNDDDEKEVWHLIWEGIYKKMPAVIYRSIIDNGHATGPFGLGSRAAIKCNYSYSPNSYPHKTRNP